MPSIDERKFEFGKGRIIRKGRDITLIATGETVFPALLAAIKLEHDFKIQAGLISMHTSKPLDHELLEKVASETGAILTVEEHSVFGGLGEACASFLLQNNFRKPFKIMGIPDEYTITGSQLEIFDHYGISENGITDTVLNLLEKKD